MIGYNKIHKPWGEFKYYLHCLSISEPEAGDLRVTTPFTELFFFSFWPGNHFKHMILFNFHSKFKKQKLLTPFSKRRNKLGEATWIGQGQAAIKWQSWNWTKFCLYSKPNALNHRLLSESVRLTLNCCLFKLCVGKKSAGQYLHRLRWRVRFCSSTYPLPAMEAEKRVFTKAKRRRGKSRVTVTVCLHFSGQIGNWAQGLINPLACTLFKRHTRL